MKTKNRIVWLFLLLIVIISFSTTIGTFEPFVVAPRARANYRANNEPFVVAPRAKAAYRTNNY